MKRQADGWRCEAEARSTNASDDSIRLVRPVRPKPAQTGGWAVRSNTFFKHYCADTLGLLPGPMLLSTRVDEAMPNDHSGASRPPSSAREPAIHFHSFRDES
jgi:hypothetical protein